VGGARRADAGSAGAAVRDALAREHGAALEVAGEALPAFPLPEALLAVREPPRGIPEEKLRRLHAVAEAALAGRLDADALLALPREEALARLEEIRGIGPFSARLVLIRGTGATDVAATEEPRVRARIAELYGADADPEAVADGWRPFRTCVSVLLRSSAR
jgi:DNA-3-methyladenine glycosylase II